MEPLISKLLDRYERGSISRRDLIRGLAALAAATTAVPTEGEAAVPFQCRFLEHVSIATENPQKLADWYKDVLGLVQRPLREDKAVRLGLPGKTRTLIVFRTGPVTKIVDHFAMAVDPFDRKALLEYCKQKNIPNDTETEFLIKDPEGIQCQLMADGSQR